MYSVCGITFDSAGSGSFYNGSARNVINFGVVNSLLTHADIQKNKFVMLGEGPTFQFNESFDSAEKSIVLILVNHPQNFAWVRIIMVIIVICLLIEKKSLNFKPTIKMLNFQLNFVLEVYI